MVIEKMSYERHYNRRIIERKNLNVDIPTIVFSHFNAYLISIVTYCMVCICVCQEIDFILFYLWLQMNERSELKWLGYYLIIIGRGKLPYKLITRSLI